MRVSTVRKAQHAANIFLTRVKVLLAEEAEIEKRSARTSNDSYVTGSATSGAVRRASMDLTRALAEMRRP